MTHHFKKSSSVQSCSHDGNHLTITFTSGHTYCYENVPENLHSDFKNADSPGKFFHSMINGKYKHKKVEE